MTLLDTLPLAITLTGLVWLVLMAYANRPPARNYRDER